MQNGILPKGDAVFTCAFMKRKDCYRYQLSGMVARIAGSSPIPSMRKMTGPSPFGQVTQAVRASRIQPRPPPQSNPMRNQNGIWISPKRTKK